MKIKIKTKLLLIIFILSIYQTSTANIFSAVITIDDGMSQTFGFNKIKDVTDAFKDRELVANFGMDYMMHSQVTSVVDYRGLPVEINFNDSTSPTHLQFKIASLGIDKEFSGNSRSDSLKQLRDFLLKEGSGLLNRIAKELVAESPVDPLAGNPNSLMGQMIDRSFSQGILTESKPSSKKVVGGGKSNHSFGMAARFGRFNQGGNEVDSFSLPLSYSFYVNDNKTSKLILTLPLTYTRVQNSAQSFQAGIGIGWSQRVTENWILTPAVSYGATGSIDLGSVGQVISGSLTSIYSWNLGENWHNISISLANTGAYYKTLPLSIGGLKIDQDLTNYVIKNGIIGIMPVKIDSLNANFNLKAYFTDTEFFGDKLFAEQYNEVGVSFTTNNKESLFDDLGINIGYLFSIEGDDVEGFNINLGYEF